MQDDPPEEDTVKVSSRMFVSCGGCKEVSDVAKTCLYCGKPLIAVWNWTLMILYVVLFAGAAFLAYLSDNK